MKNKILVLILLIILGISSMFLCSSINMIDKDVIKELEETVLESSNAEVTVDSQEYMFEDTINESEIADLPKGYIFIVFHNSSCTKEEAIDFINKLDKKKYLGVIGDNHYIQMNTSDYEELYQICYNLMQNELVAVANVNQQMFDDTMTSDDVEAIKGKDVIYYQYIPSGKEADVNMDENKNVNKDTIMIKNDN